MSITAIKDFKIKESYANLIRTKLWSYLWEGIYKPMFEIMQIKPQKAQNSIDPVTEGLREGRLYYVDGGFKAKDKFTNAQSVQLQKWGAKWDKYKKMYKIEQERLPQQLQVTLAQSQILAKQQIQLVQNYLKEVQANMPYIVESMVFDNEVITILDDAGNEVKKNVKHLNVIEPELSIEQKREIARTYTNNMRDYVIKDFAQERIPEMRKKIQELVLKGYRPDKVQELLEKEYGIASRKAKFLAQNETSIMLAEYKKSTYKEMGFDKFIWKTITDGRERELHKQLNNTTWSYDNPPVIDERTGQRGLPGQTYNCLVGEMNIATPFLYKRIFKRKFRGELTSIVLPMGIIKVTPNHPILTSRGWIAAKFIKVGDKVAKISSESFPAIGSNPNDIKITIEEFFGFYSILFKRERVAVSDKDFHGDISIDQQVDVINIENKLRDCFNPEFTKLKLEQFLTKAHKFGIYSASDRAFYQAFPFCWFTSDSFISRLSQVFSFFFSSEFHSVEHSLRAIAWLDSLLNETCGYSFSRDAEFLSQLFNTPAGSIKFYQLIVWNIFFDIISNNLIPSLLHSNREMSCATAETLSNLSEAKPAFIEFDTVIDKIISKSSDIHIYNLENSNNWYLTENYITKNCRCEAIPFRSGAEIKIKGRISEKNSKDKISSYLIKHAKNAADEDIEWITVKGNHIPIKKGQTKEEAVKDWLEQKHDKNVEIKTPAVPPTDGVIKDTVKKLYKRYKESNCESIEPAYQYPEKIAGVKRGKPMSFHQADNGRANPKYTPRDYLYYRNCQSCVVAHEARMRGYDVQAMPRDLNPKSKSAQLAANSSWAWLDTKTGKKCGYKRINVSNAKKLYDYFEKNIKQGERYQTAYYWSGKDNNIKGHVLTIARDETGELRLYDPQTNKIKRGKEIINYYSNHRIIFDVPVLKPKILRVDDKKFNPYFVNDVVH